jgi:hypothetical protein
MALSGAQKLAALTDYASRSGVLHEEMDYDESTDSLIIRTSQNCDAILERNKELQNEGLHGDGYSASRNWRRAATIPLVVIHKWLQEGVNFYDKNDAAAVKRKLNDPEYAYLRTSRGRV